VSLPFKIDYLLTSGRVESERLEFKTGWNPLKVMQFQVGDFHLIGAAALPYYAALMGPLTKIALCHGALLTAGGTRRCLPSQESVSNAFQEVTGRTRMLRKLLSMNAWRGG